MEVHTFWPSITHSSPSRTRPAGEPGQVGPGAGLAEELAPGVLSGDDVADVAVDLLLGAVGGDGGGGQEQAEAPWARRARRRSRSPSARPRRRCATALGRRRWSGRVGADHPARPSRSHQPATVRSGSQFSSNQVRSSSTRSSTALPPVSVVVSVIVWPLVSGGAASLRRAPTIASPLRNARTTTDFLPGGCHLRAARRQSRRSPPSSCGSHGREPTVPAMMGRLDRGEL